MLDMATTTIDTKDLQALIHYARQGAGDMANQIIDEIIARMVLSIEEG